MFLFTLYRGHERPQLQLFGLMIDFDFSAVVRPSCRHTSAGVKLYTQHCWPCERLIDIQTVKKPLKCDSYCPF